MPPCRARSTSRRRRRTTVPGPAHRSAALRAPGGGREVAPSAASGPPTASLGGSSAERPFQLCPPPIPLPVAFRNRALDEATEMGVELALLEEKELAALKTTRPPEPFDPLLFGQRLMELGREEELVARVKHVGLEEEVES